MKGSKKIINLRWERFKHKLNKVLAGIKKKFFEIIHINRPVRKEAVSDYNKRKKIKKTNMRPY